MHIASMRRPTNWKVPIPTTLVSPQGVIRLEAELRCDLANARISSLSHRPEAAWIGLVDSAIGC